MAKLGRGGLGAFAERLVFQAHQEQPGRQALKDRQVSQVFEARRGHRELQV
jgi:hypothetical protein